MTGLTIGGPRIKGPGPKRAGPTSPGPRIRGPGLARICLGSLTGLSAKASATRAERTTKTCETIRAF